MTQVINKEAEFLWSSLPYKMLPGTGDVVRLGGDLSRPLIVQNIEKDIHPGVFYVDTQGERQSSKPFRQITYTLESGDGNIIFSIPEALYWFPTAGAVCEWNSIRYEAAIQRHLRRLQTVKKRHPSNAADINKQVELIKQGDLYLANKDNGSWLHDPFTVQSYGPKYAKVLNEKLSAPHELPISCLVVIKRGEKHG